MIHASTTVVLPSTNTSSFDPGATPLNAINDIKVEEGAVVIWHPRYTLWNHSFRGRPLVALWDGHRLLGIGYSATQGEPLDAAQAEAVLAAIKAGQYAEQDAIDALVIEGQQAAMPTFETITNAPMVKLETGDQPGYLRERHASDGSVHHMYNRMEILRQITGFDWQGQLVNLNEDASRAREAIATVFGAEYVEYFTALGEEGSLYPHFAIHVHRSGLVAIIDWADTEVVSLAIVVPGTDDFVTRTVVVKPTITKKAA